MSIQSQAHKFGATILQNLPEVPEDIMQNWIENPRALQKLLSGLCPSVNGSDNSVQQQLQQWDSFYKKHFNLVLGDVATTERQSGFDRLIVVASGLTLNQVYDECAKQFKCWRYADDLDSSVTTNDRDPKNGAYAIWLRDRQEADEENKNLSADQLATQQVKGITLTERMLYELKYHDETGKHLDIRNWTLCAGSRCSGGNVPSTGWSGVEFEVDWNHSVTHGGSLRARSVVSCQS